MMQYLHGMMSGIRMPVCPSGISSWYYLQMGEVLWSGGISVNIDKIGGNLKLLFEIGNVITNARFFPW